MPHRRHRLKRLLSRFRTGDLHALEALDLDDHAHALDAGDESSERDPLANARRFGGHRMAASLTFAVLFFAGAAFSAGAGDIVAEAVDSATTEAAAPAAAPEAPSAAPETTPAEGEDPECTKWMKEFDREECADESEAAESAPAEGAPEQPAPAAPEAAPEAPAPDAEQPAAAPSESASADEAAETDDARPQGLRPVAPKAPNPALARAHARGKRSARPAARPKGKPVLARKLRVKRHESGHEPKQGAPEFGTMWLDRDLPDPTPPSRRLTRAFARDLKAASRKANVRWADVLAVLRARGDRGQAPAGRAGLNALASRLAELGARADSWGAFLALEGRTSFADRALALSRYHRAVGLSALVRGLEWAKPGLVKRVLKDERIQIYWGGREDIADDKTDVRVLVLLAYLAEAHGQVTVTSLTSGHGYFSRPGVVSAHMYGLAVDIAALGGISMTGNQQPGSVTEDAVRHILLLPAELRPLQVISLLGLGGPSFPMANHYDHIHVGY
jgi:hypothetical protein